MNQEGFVKLRRGVMEHIRLGKLLPSDLGIFTFLLLAAEYQGEEAGDYFGTAGTIADSFNDRRLQRKVHKSLDRLRTLTYIGWPNGGSGRHSFTISINNYEVTQGRKLGQRTSVTMDKGKVIKIFLPGTQDGTVEVPVAGTVAGTVGGMSKVNRNAEVLSINHVTSTVEERKKEERIVPANTQAARSVDTDNPTVLICSILGTKALSIADTKKCASLPVDVLKFVSTSDKWLSKIRSADYPVTYLLRCIKQGWIQEDIDSPNTTAFEPQATRDPDQRGVEGCERCSGWGSYPRGVGKVEICKCVSTGVKQPWHFDDQPYLGTVN